MTDDSGRDPTVDKPLEAIPRDGWPLAAAIKPFVPQPDDLKTKRADGAAVERDAIIVHVPTYQRINVASLLRDRLVPSLLKSAL